MLKQFRKWLETFYKNHRGDMRYEPMAKQGWQAALKEVLKQLNGIYNGDFENSEIVKWIEQELGGT